MDVMDSSDDHPGDGAVRTVHHCAVSAADRETGAEHHRARFEALFASQWKPILGFAARRCETPSDAADVAAETFTVAWRRIADVPAGDEARLWLYGVARQVLANHRRGERRKDRLGAALQEAWTEVSAADPAHLFAIGEDARRVRSALHLLPQLDADLLTMTAWEGLSSAQAGAVLRMSAVATRARLSRARRRLRHILADTPHDAGHRTSAPSPAPSGTPPRSAPRPAAPHPSICLEEPS